MKKQTQFFRTENGDRHMIDTADNHFVNGMCVNPTIHDSTLVDGVYVEAQIGDTHPPMEDRIYFNAEQQ